MRIAYCTNVRLPSERAHGHQIAQVCEAFTVIGHTVTVFAPFRKNPVKQDFHEYYNLPKSIELKILGTFDPINRFWLPGLIGGITMNTILKKEYKAAIKDKDFDVLYTRAPVLLPALTLIGIPIILELHQLPRMRRRKFVILARQCAHVVALTSVMKNTLVEWGIPKHKISVEGDGVDLRRFADLPDLKDARKKIGLTTDRLVVGYVGRLKTLGMEKGVKHLLEALKELQPGKDFTGLIVGGPKSDTDEYRAMARRMKLSDDDVRFIGEVPSSDVSLYLSACDFLAMPFPDFPHYRNNMSPLKMFEYMASSRPIITSDLPSIRDVLSDGTAYFFKPGDSKDLAKVLRKMKEFPERVIKRAEQSRLKVEKYAWPVRMKRILQDTFNPL